MEHENSVKSEVDLESDSEPKLEIAEEQPHHNHMNTGKIFLKKFTKMYLIEKKGYCEFVKLINEG